MLFFQTTKETQPVETRFRTMRVYQQRSTSMSLWGKMSGYIRLYAALVWLSGVTVFIVSCSHNKNAEIELPPKPACRPGRIKVNF